MADRYWVGGNDNWNATAGTKWALTSGGTGGEAVPTSSDAVYLDNGTGTGSVTVSATAACASLNCTGYVNTLTVNALLEVSGAITLAAGMSSGGTSIMRTIVASNLTSNGHQWNARFGCHGTSQTFTFVDDWTLGASGKFESGGTTPTINGQTITSPGGIAVWATVGGTTAIVLTGGTWSGTNVLTNNTTLAGDVTVSGVVNYATGTLTYSSGTITVTGSTLRLMTSTVNTNGMTWNTVSVNGTPTITLNSLLSATTLTIPGDATANFIGTAGWTVGTLSGGTVTTSFKTITLKYGNTYTVTSAMTLAGASESLYYLITSNENPNRVVLNMSGTSPNLVYVRGTRINSNGGNPIYTNTTFTECNNWFATPAGGVMWLT